MAYTVTYIENVAEDGTPLDPSYEVTNHHEFHHGIADEPGDYFEDEFGNIHHRYSDLDQSRVHQIEDQANFGDDDEYYQEEALEEEIALSPELIDHCYGIVGGEENYQTMVEWAAENLSPEQIENYDRVMDSGNQELMQEFITWLARAYNTYN